MSYLISDAPEIRLAMRTGYGYDGESFETQVPVYMTDEGEMTLKEAIAYMISYVKSNPDDAAEAFGIEKRYETVACDAYGAPI